MPATGEWRSVFICGFLFSLGSYASPADCRPLRSAGKIGGSCGRKTSAWPKDCAPSREAPLDGNPSSAGRRSYAPPGPRPRRPRHDTGGNCLPPPARRADKPDDLRLPTHGKHRGMPQPVLGLEAVLSRQRRVRHVTIVARGHVGMAAVLPGDVLGSHNVAIHARLWGVAQVRSGAGDVKHEERHAARYAQQDESCRPPAGCKEPQRGEPSGDGSQRGHATVLIRRWQRLRQSTESGPSGSAIVLPHDFW